MARLRIPQGFGQVGLVFEGGGTVHNAVITFGVENNDLGAPINETLNNIAAVWGDAWADTLNANIDMVQARYTTQDAAGNYGTVVTPQAIAGTRGFSLPPANTATLIHKSSNVPFRYGRGRNGIYGLTSEGEIDDSGGLSGPHLALLQGDATQFLNGLAGINTPMVILHDEALGADIEPTPVTAYTVDARVSTQRRRLRD